MHENEILEILRKILSVQGITEDDHHYTSQFLRDKFPDGVPADLAIMALKEVNRGNDILENSALIWLAMVPTPGIADEVLTRLNNYRAQQEQTKHTLSERFQLAQALLFLGLEEGKSEFNYLRNLMDTYPEYGQPVPDTYFREIDELLAQWKKDRAEGKRWEPEE